MLQSHCGGYAPSQAWAVHAHLCRGLEERASVVLFRSHCCGYLEEEPSQMLQPNRCRQLEDC